MYHKNHTKKEKKYPKGRLEEMAEEMHKKMMEKMDKDDKGRTAKRKKKGG